MEHYVTLFDSLFLPQGVALHRSMERHLGCFTLWILCIDDEAYELLDRMRLPKTKLIRLGDVETEELKRIKASRTRGEYCWTLTPFAPRFVFEEDASVPRVTYLDSDVWFRGAPRTIFREFDASGKSVLITDHAYSHEFDYTSSSGRFCVQFMTFVRGSSEPVRSWWQAQCIDWCFARHEGGKFGDQMYLNDWPERFEDEIHVLRDAGLTLAPWNVTRFPYGTSLLYHFQGLRLLARKRVLLGPALPLPQAVQDFVYGPYIDDLGSAVARLESVGWVYRAQRADPSLVEKARGAARNVMRILAKLGRTRVARLEA